MSANAALVVMMTSLMAVSMVTAQSSASCSSFPQFSNETSATLMLIPSLQLWHGAVMIVGFGLFATFIAIIFRLVRKLLYHDDHLMDTYFDAGGDANFAMVACAVIARWLWTSSFTWSTLNFYQFGIAGHFWFSAAATVPILLFVIVACQIRIKAPGAKTFLQVIKRRFGTASHIVLIIVALIVNILVAGIIALETVRIVSSLTNSFSPNAAHILLAITVGLFTAVGGVGGGLYVSYFTVLTAVGIALTYFIDTLYNPFNRAGSLFTGSNVVETLYNTTSCAHSTGNQADSALTFSSHGGLLEAVLIVLCGFSSVFLNQSFWQAAIIGKPMQVVIGYLTGSLAFFGIPLLLSFVFGVTYWVLSIQQGSPAVSQDMAVLGYLPAIMSQKLMGGNGDLLMCALSLVVAMTALSAQIVAMTSIIVYDIYETYFDPHVAAQTSTTTTVISKSSTSPTVSRVVETGDAATATASAEAHRRRVNFVRRFASIFSAHAAFTSTSIMLNIGISLPWIFKVIGVVGGSSVIPVFMSVTWHRTTRAGVLGGVIVGLAAGLTGWLVYASTFDGGLVFRNSARQEAFIVGVSLALGVGGLVCLLLSLTCGGCGSALHEDEVWESTAQIDSATAPWAVRYADDIGADDGGVNRRTGLPHFYQMRGIFKMAEIAAYVGGIVLSIILVIVWPALMLIAGVFTLSTFVNWAIMILVWGIIAAIYIGLVPLILEILQNCRYAYYAREMKHIRFTDDISTTTLTPPMPRTLQTVQVPQPLPVLVDVHTSTLPHYHGGGISHDFNSTATYVRPLATISGNTINSSSSQWKTSVHLD